LPILPIVDLLVLLGTGSLVLGFILKSIAIATVYRPAILGFSSLDFVVITGVCFGLALVLVARTWLKLNEPGLLVLQSRLRAEDAHRRVHEAEAANHDGNGNGNRQGQREVPAAALGSAEMR
jgi:hypothetical protein